MTKTNFCLAASKLAIASAMLLTLSACAKHEDAAITHEAATASETHDDHAAHSAPSLAEGELWPTDAPLRAAMGRIQTAVAAAEPAYSGGSLQQIDAQALAAQVESDVRYMIENCKLAPEPDAALHVLIARMMSAASVLKSNAASAEGVPALAAVVHDYQATFDHSASGG